MAHFAELDANNVVLRVVVISNDDCKDESGVEQEQLGIKRCLELFKTGTWLQTSYNGKFRKNYAGIGGTYDAQRDAFIPPKPDGEGWVLDEVTCDWVNPELEAKQAAVTIGVTRV